MPIDLKTALVNIGSHLSNVVPGRKGIDTFGGIPQEIRVSRDIINRAKTHRPSMVGCGRSGFESKMRSGDLMRLAREGFRLLGHARQRCLTNGRYCHNGRCNPPDSFYRDACRRVYDHERRCGRAYYGVDHRRFGPFGPTMCRDVHFRGRPDAWLDCVRHCREVDWVPVPACPPMQQIEIIIDDTGKQAAELKEKIIGPNAKRLPAIEMPGYKAETPITEIVHLESALRVQNKDSHEDFVADDKEVDKLGGEAKEHAIAEYLLYQIYEKGRPADQINLKIHGNLVELDGRRIIAGNSIDRKAVYSIMLREIMEEGGMMNHISQSIVDHGNTLEPHEKVHYYEQVVEPAFRNTEDFKNYLLSISNKNPAHCQALKFIYGGPSQEGLNQTKLGITKHIFDKDKGAAKILEKKAFKSVGSDDIDWFNLKAGANSEAFRLGLAIFTVAGLIASPFLLFKAFKNHPKETWVGIAVVLLGIPLATGGKGIFSTTKSLWNDLMEFDGIDRVVGSNKDAMIGAEHNIDIGNEEDLASLILGQSHHFRDEDLEALASPINDHPSNYHEQKLNGIRILLLMAAQQNGKSPSDLLERVKNGREDRLRRLRIEKITKHPTANTVNIHWEGQRGLAPQNTPIPWSDDPKTEIEYNLTSSKSLFPQAINFEESYDKLRTISRTAGKYNETDAGNMVSGAIEFGRQSLEEIGRNLGAEVRDGVLILADGTKWLYNAANGILSNVIWPSIKRLASDLEKGVKKVWHDTYPEFKGLLREIGGEMRIVGEDIYQGIELVMNMTSDSIKYIRDNKYAGIGVVIDETGLTAEDLITAMYQDRLIPLLEHTWQAGNRVTLDLSNVAINTWNSIENEVFAVDPNASAPGDIVPWIINPIMPTSGPARLLWIALKSGQEVFETGTDIIYKTGEKFIKISKEKLKQGWNFVSTQSAELGAYILALPATVRLQLAALSHVNTVGRSRISRFTGGLDPSETAFVTHCLNMIANCTVVDKNIIDQIITWDFSQRGPLSIPLPFGWTTPSWLPSWLGGNRRIGIPSIDIPNIGPVTNQATYDFSPHKQRYVNALKSWAQKKILSEAPGTPRHTTFDDIINNL